MRHRRPEELDVVRGRTRSHPEAIDTRTIPTSMGFDCCDYSFLDSLKELLCEVALNPSLLTPVVSQSQTSLDSELPTSLEESLSHTLSRQSYYIRRRCVC